MGNGVDINHAKNIARLVVPSLEMGGFGGSDTQQDAKNLDIGHALGKRRIQAATALFDRAKVKSRGEGDGFERSGMSNGAMCAGPTRSSSVRGIAVRFVMFSA